MYIVKFIIRFIFLVLLLSAAYLGFEYWSFLNGPDLLVQDETPSEDLDSFVEGKTVENYVPLKTVDFSESNDLSLWTMQSLSKNNTMYEVSKFEGNPCVKAESDDAASALYFQQKLSRDKKPFISWKWHVEQFPDKVNEQLDEKEEFDFAAQVYVVFYSRTFFSTKAIQYVWANNLAKGTIASNPYTKNVKLLVLRSGPEEDWVSERRDIAEDYELLFGVKPKKDVDKVAFMTDSDSTDTAAIAYYSDLVFGYIEQKKIVTKIKGETVRKEQGQGKSLAAFVEYLKTKKKEIPWLSNI